MSKTKRTISAIVIFATVFAAATAQAIDFCAFAHKAYIDFNGYEGTETLTNFPALVRLAEGTGGFSYADCALPQGRDVRFSLGDGRELPSEVASWNPSGTSEFYVRVPELTASTRIMVFWGNAAAPVRDPRLKVWDRSYTGVYGMGETGKVILDSSWTGGHGAAMNASGGAAGAVGSARTFSNEDAVYGNDYCGAAPNGKTMTLECWFKVASNPGTTVPLLIFNRPEQFNAERLGSFGSIYYNSGIAIRLTNGGKLNAYAGDFSITGSRYDASAAAAAAQNEWHHALLSWSFDEMTQKGSVRLYQDGLQVASSDNITFVWAEGQRHLVWTGYSQYSNKAHYTGMLDEVRVSSVVRSADYAAAVFKNISDFEHFAAIADATSMPYAETTPAATPRYTVTLTAGAGGTVSPQGATVVEEGGTLVVTATPDSEAYGFHSWEGNGPELERFSRTFTLEVHEDVAMEAVFGKAYYVKTAADGGDDAHVGRTASTAFATIDGAVRTINADASNFPAVLFVLPGTYTFSNPQAALAWGTEELKRNFACFVTNALAIRATEKRQAVIDFQRRNSGNNSLCPGFLLNNDGALLEGLVLSNAYSNGYAIEVDARIRKGHMKDCAVGWSSMAPYGQAHDVTLCDGWIRDTAFVKWTRNNNSATAWGGPLFVAGGIVDSCVFSNTASAKSALAVYGRATIRNSLFANNTAFGNGGAVYVKRPLTYSGAINFENCTFVGNSAPNYGGAVYAEVNGGCNLVNCAFLDNSVAQAANGMDAYNANHAYSISPYTDATDGNVVGTPTFKESDDGTYQPTGVSLTGDAGFPLPWALHPAATDLYGNARLHGDGIDIGAAEYAPSQDEGFEINLSASVVSGVDTLATSFSATVMGAGAGGLAYAWEFGDGTTSTDVSPTHTYDAPGYYTVTLMVTDLATGRIATATQMNIIKVLPTITYVRSLDDGEWTPVEPYCSYETAATTILAAFNLGTTKIECGAGTIALGNDRIYADASRAVEIYGQGRNATLVNCNGNYFHLENPSAILRDLTLFNTYVHTSAYTYQGAVNIYNGAMVSNCVIRNPVSDSYTRMLWMNGGGRLFDSAIINSSSRYGSVALGAYIDGPATIDRCVFSNLVAKSTGAPSCAIQVAGTYTPSVIIRNTLVADCRVTDSGSAYGSAIRVNGNALVENCTIVDNFAKSTASAIISAGLYASGNGLHVTNSVVWGNVCTNTAAGGEQTIRDVFVATGKTATFSHCDFSEAESIASASVTTAACLARDPLFRDATHGDFNFGSSSPLLNAGVHLPWMEDAMDLAGNPRLFGRRPDIGCFESSARAQTIILLR